MPLFFSAFFSALSWPRPRAAAVAALSAGLLLAGCATTSSRRVSYEPEGFDSTTTHTRNFAATEAQTCEAARRALLSQGYLITAANADLVTGRKSFQPANEVHVEVEFRVVCAKDAAVDKSKPKRPSTIAFVSALQDRYSLKKTNNSASVGVGVIGSVSLPFSASDDALVKVASETLTDGRFYDRFFVLLDQYLAVDPSSPDPEPAPAALAPAPASAPAAPTAPPAQLPTPTPVAPAAAPATAPAASSTPSSETHVPVPAAENRA
jgi:Uncharacterized protein conserved in bacteria (DUF2242)